MHVLILMGSPRLNGNATELCKHSNLISQGLYSVRDQDNFASFRSPGAVKSTKNFARKLVQV